jgi:hypothetical protein
MSKKKLIIIVLIILVFGTYIFIVFGKKDCGYDIGININPFCVCNDNFECARPGELCAPPPFPRCHKIKF